MNIEHASNTHSCVSTESCSPFRLLPLLRLSLSSVSDFFSPPRRVETRCELCRRNIWSQLRVYRRCCWYVVTFVVRFLCLLTLLLFFLSSRSVLILLFNPLSSPSIGKAHKKYRDENGSKIAHVLTSINEHYFFLLHLRLGRLFMQSMLVVCIKFYNSKCSMNFPIRQWKTKKRREATTTTTTVAASIQFSSNGFTRNEQWNENVAWM